MLKVFNDLEPFFQDNYRRINVREYARLSKISPPSASKVLSQLHKEALLNREKDRNYIYFSANKESPAFIILSRAYWLFRLKKIGFVDYVEKNYINPVVILFGSFSKAEIKHDSDIDIAIFTPSKTKINPEAFEKRLKHKIQIFIFRNKEEVKNKELLNNILNGFIIAGNW